MPRGRQSNDMANMLGMLGMDNAGGENLDNDADLNAELEALLSGNEPPPPTRKRNKGGGSKLADPSADLSLEAQVAMAMRDVPDDMADVDENDDELMAELNEIMDQEESSPGESSGPASPVKSSVAAGCSADTVLARLDDYRMAMAMAESTGDSGRSRRYQRSVQNLEEILSRVRAGQNVSESDLPPPVPHHEPASHAPTPAARKSVQPPVSAPAPVISAPVTSAPVPAPTKPLSPQHGQLPMLTNRRDQYKVAALQAKRSGNLPEAKNCVQIAKQFDAVIAAIESGETADLSNIPPAPSSGATSDEKPAAPSKKLPLSEDLQARMDVMKKTQQKAQEEGNSSKARRMGRVVAAYQEAIAACRAGKPYPYSELALPPGFEPLSADAAPAPAPAAPAPAAPAPAAVAPVASASVATAAKGGKSLLTDLEARMQTMLKTQQKAQEEGNSTKARRMGRVITAYKEAIAACRAGKPYPYSELALPPGFEPLEDSAGGSAPAPTAATPAAGTAVAAGTRAAPTPPKLQRQLSRSTNQTLVFLQERQRRFKEAALKAKNEGKKDLALTYLRQSKGFDPMITAAENGLPVDMAKLPSLPGEKEVDFDFLRAEDCDMPDDLDMSDPKALYRQLTSKLQAQIQLCKSNSSRCARMGDVATAGKFDRLLKTSQLDLAALRSSEKHGDEVPRFHFEWKTFTTERSNPDLGDDAMELQVVRGIDIATPGGFQPDQLDTYVRAELPFPSTDEPQVFTTETVRRTNCPDYSAVGGTHRFNINRRQRSFQRLIHSRSIKMEIFYKRGFLKSDKVLGTATVRLATLEERCELHDSFDLMDGRKAIGGRLEVRVRLREPVSGRHVEETREKWLVIDAAAAKTIAPSAPVAAAKSEQTDSIEVLRYERDLLVQKMKSLGSQLTPTSKKTLSTKQVELESRIAAMEKQLREGGPNALKSYASMLLKLAPGFHDDAREQLKVGNKEKASMFMTKKKLVEKEAANIRAKLGSK